MRISEATVTHLIQNLKRQQQKQEHNNSGPSSSTLNPEVVTSQPQLLQSQQPQHQHEHPEPSSQLSELGQVQYQASILHEEGQQQQQPSPSQQQGHGQNQNNLPLQPLQEAPPTSPSSNNSKYTDDSIISMTGPTSFNSGDVQAVILSNHSSFSFLPSVPSRSVQADKTNSVTHGGPLFHFLGDDMGVDNGAMVNTDDNSSHYPIATTIPSPVNVKTELSSFNPPSEAPEPGQKTNVESGEGRLESTSGINYVNSLSHEIAGMVTSKDEDLIEEPEPEQQTSPEDRWDPDQSWETRFFKTILDERRRREEQILLMKQEKEWINQQRYNIEQSKRDLDNIRYDLEIREQRALEIEPFLPMARQLRGMSLGFDELLPWVSAIQEKSVLEKISVSMAAADIAKTIRSYRQVRSLQDAIEHKQKELASIDAAIGQRHQVISTLTNLLNAGVTEAEILEATCFYEWTKQWHTQDSIGGNNGHDAAGSKMFRMRLDDKLIGIGH
ncbi:MAG: carboxymuconolactone decarboxylase family protein [Candidatus Nitrosopolaris sp.]